MEKKSFLLGLNDVDRWLLHQINPDSPQAFLDWLMIAISSHSIWVLPLVLWVGISIKNRNKNWWMPLVLVFFIVGMSDFFTYQALKPYFGRIRPCKVDELVRIVYSCGGTFSFPSNHATNSMTFAFLLFWWGGIKKIAYGFMAFAVLVGFSRVYLGVHYPGDVMAGFLLGGVWATCISLILQRQPNLKEKVSSSLY